MNTVIKVLYAPMFFLGFIWAGVYVVEAGTLAWIFPLLLLAICISFVAEQLIPYEKIWNKSKGDITRDLLHGIVNEATLAITVALIPVMTMFIPYVSFWPYDWPLWGQLIFALLIADFGITMAHYYSHKYDLLWRLHAVHHSVKRMYSFNGLMKHPFHQAIELTAGTLPLLLMGMPMEVGALLGFCAAIQLLLQHSNVDMKVGPLIYIWAIAPGHRQHHINRGKEGDVNFGLFTMIWDHLLGTHVTDSASRPAPVDGDLGIGSQPNYPQSYLAQLIEPFRTKTK